MATTLGVKIEDETLARLKHLSEARQRSQHWLMRQAIQRYLDEEEVREQARREAITRWERYEETGEALDHTVVTAWLKTWGTEDEGECPV